jgi:hypothetical protein
MIASMMVIGTQNGWLRRSAGSRSRGSGHPRCGADCLVLVLCHGSGCGDRDRFLLLPNMPDAA